MKSERQIGVQMNLITIDRPTDKHRHCKCIQTDIHRDKTDVIDRNTDGDKRKSNR